MTPKERADFLIDKFKEIQYPDFQSEQQAKQCALFVVDEILDIIEDDGFTFAEYQDKKTIEFWFEVKSKING